MRRRAERKRRTSSARRRDAGPGRPEEHETGVDRDRSHRCSRAGPAATDPVGRRAEEERCERDDQDEAGDDEREAADHRRSQSAHPPCRVDRELCRSRAGKEVDGSEAVLELLGPHPPTTVHDELAKERDVCGRATEADDADPSPRACDRSERGHAASTRRRFPWPPRPRRPQRRPRVAVGRGARRSRRR